MLVILFGPGWNSRLAVCSVRMMPRRGNDALARSVSVSRRPADHRELRDGQWQAQPANPGRIRTGIVRSSQRAVPSSSICARLVRIRAGSLFEQRQRGRRKGAFDLEQAPFGDDTAVR